jgi:2-polyprenyl-3-methyl-5-hydroxy-6-metoxy-1,4-benzoquinol methylase
MPYSIAEVAPAGSPIAERIRASMYNYLRHDLGRPEEFCRSRAEVEANGTRGRAVCEDCEREGLSFAGKTVLDLGSGLGTASAEIARRGARVVALEPYENWCRIGSERLSVEPHAHVIRSVGERLPIADASIDIVVSFQVLEHVRNPRSVIREVFRVLKPGGLAFISYENYLSFREPHYQVPWLPVLPKSLGALYLKWLGRDPRFLCESVTYTTFPAVRTAFLGAGFQCVRVSGFKHSLETGRGGAKWRALALVSRISQPFALRLLCGMDYFRRLFRTATTEFMQKPA